MDAIRSYPHLGFWDDFNRVTVDPDFWTATLDGGGTFAVLLAGDEPTFWALNTGNVIDNDSCIIADGVYGKRFTPFEEGKTTITFEARIKLVSITDISALIGLFQVPPTDYAEPATDCAHFFMDPAVTSTFRARTYDSAVEEETDSLIALDTAYHKLGIIITRTEVTFYIDDVLVATHATRVPDVPLMIGILIRTEAGAQKNLRIDYVRVGLS